MYGIDVIALRWGIGIVIFFLIVWVIMARKLLKREPKVKKVNLADRYNDLNDNYLRTFGINSKEFKQMVFDNFMKIDNAFMNYDYESLKRYLTNDLHDYYVEQLDILKNNKYKNILDNFELLSIKIYNVINEHNMLMVSVYLNVRMCDYVIDVNTGKCVKGDKDNIDYEFELTFLKKSTYQKDKCEFLLCKKSCVNDMKVDKKKDK